MEIVLGLLVSSVCNVIIIIKESNVKRGTAAERSRALAAVREGRGSNPLLGLFFSV